MNELEDRILKRLRLLGEGPPAFFEDACKVMGDPDNFAAPTHLVSFCVREIESALRDTLTPLTEIETAAATAKISSGKRHEWEIRQILNALEIEESSEVGQMWLSLSGQDNPGALSSRTHRRHLGIRPFDEEFVLFWKNMLHILDAALDLVENRFLRYHDEIDRLLSIPQPLDDDVKRLLNTVADHYVTRRYLFRKLDSLEWLHALRANGYFRHASPGSWPASDYLKRISTKHPQLVADLIMEIPTTVGLWTMLDLLDAAMEIDVETRSVWVMEKLIPWIGRQERLTWTAPDKIQSLLKSLIAMREINPALALLRATLGVGLSAFSRADADSMAERHDVEELLENIAPLLIKASPAESFEQALALFRQITDGRDSVTEYDFIWRSSIGDDSELSEGPIDLAISFLREASVGFAEASPEATSSIYERLSESKSVLVACKREIGTIRIVFYRYAYRAEYSG